MARLCRPVRRALQRRTPLTDLDGEKGREEGYKSLLSGAAPEVRKFATADEEGAFLVETVKEMLRHKQPEEVCLAPRTGKLLTERYQPLLKAACGSYGRGPSSSARVGTLLAIDRPL